MGTVNTLLADYERLVPGLKSIAGALSDQEKGDVPIMLLEVAAADGEWHVGELEAINEAASIMGMSRNAVHEVFDHYFSNN